MNETGTTPDRLIQVARKLFAEKGFDGVSVREITAQADANLGAITYHYGSKQALYEAALDDAFAPVLGWIAGDGGGVDGALAKTAVGTGMERVELILRRLFAHLAANPDIQLLILRQVVQNDALPGPARRTVGVILGAIAESVRAGQSDGSIRSGDPTLMAVSVVSQPVYFGLLRRLAPERLSGVRGDPRAADVVEHAVRFVRAGLMRGAEEAE